MKKASIKTVEMDVYPSGEIANKFVNKNARFELYIADHAYIRMQQRLGDIYVKFKKSEESEVKFFERVACEACVRILQIGIVPGNIRTVKITRHDAMWVYNFQQDAPALVTVHPIKRCE